MSWFLGNNSNDKAISVLKDPFSAKKITGVNIFYRVYSKGGRWTSSIDFQNGKTSGSQEFEVDGEENLSVLLGEMDEFVKSLK